jgi:hypothetical protein
MSRKLPTLLGIAVFSAGFGATGAAQAQCCPGYSAATACSGVTLTKSRWCVQDTVPNAQSALPSAFCAYGDVVVTTLEGVFNIPAKETVEFELDTQTGGAHTGTACGHLGVGVAYDAFKGNAYGATGFWGYLLSLHEAINDWTGMASGGWPTDFWADHQSAFPNLMDFHVMDTVGVKNGDQNLIKAAAAQKKRFYPGGDTADAKVVALDNVFAAMPGGDGYEGFSKMFALISGDGVKWDRLGVPNPDVKRTEYVVAYMSLSTRKNVLDILKGPGASGGGNICNGTPDGTEGDKPYTCDAGHLDAIATAHCSIAANGKPNADLTTFRGGAYTGIKSGPCGDECPSECGCDEQQHCVPSWLAKVAPPGTGGGSGSGGSTATGGTTSNGASGGSNGGTTSPVAGGSAGVAGASPMGSGGTARGAGGSTNPDGATAGTSTAGKPRPAPDAGDESGDGSSDSGCGCRVESRGTSPKSVLFAGAALGALLFSQKLSRKRGRR